MKEAELPSPDLAGLPNAAPQSPPRATDACPACDGKFVSGSRDWYRRCIQCGFLTSDLRVAINDKVDAAIDQPEREKGFATLRKANFARILDRMKLCLGKPRGSLLEVGCAPGWFLEMAQRRGYDVTGLEPDRELYERSKSADIKVINGYFPNDLSRDARFDVIVFNDVFEHLPSPSEAMRNAAERLSPGGALVINAPDSRGVFYHTALLLDRLGIHGPLLRMWQVNYPSPHLSYFNPDSLMRLASKCGLSEMHRSTLASITMDGLWARLRVVRNLQSANIVSSAAVWTMVVAGSPLIRILPSDISLQIFRKSA
jgi:2-polyprenyl-3-methyl-5-hydroxy-6-metoxy-1,4-benzoquinol methylase